MDAFNELEQIVAFRDINRPNRFNDETCTDCSKKGHTETICFTKRDGDNMIKMAEKVSAVMAQAIAATNKLAMEGIIETLSKMNLKGYGLILTPVMEVLKSMSNRRRQMLKDYRKVNDATHKDTYPLPRIDDILDALLGAKYFCNIDLTSGYRQIKVADYENEKTAFGHTWACKSFFVYLSDSQELLQCF